MIDQDMFDRAIISCAHTAGVDAILQIPGVWELVAEEFNNDALDLVKEEEDLTDEDLVC